jgi:hypothetical protein
LRAALGDQNFDVRIGGAAREPVAPLRVGLTGCFIVGMLSDKPCSVNVFNTKTKALRAAPRKMRAPKNHGGACRATKLAGAYGTVTVLAVLIQIQ